ncbi:MAG: orotate phosphoribosyltransferase [Thermomicrobiales bacterium]|nr:orotate phosphoribosyltransferase [Thermomicrobiales bacterium]MCO5221320.1 orotate phosphoribosyltransferase [Thermomicrobiales bacterium]
MTVDLEQLFVESGALKEGHFLLASGRHSDRYLEKFDLLRNPRATSEVLEGLARELSSWEIDVIVGPTTGGILLAFELARQLGLPAAYAERIGEGMSGREIKRGTVFVPGSKVFIIDDILTTGGSVAETLNALKGLPVEVVGIAVLADRSGGSVRFGEIPLLPLLSLDIQSWPAGECPYCAESVPLVKPGSTAVT